VAKETAMEKRLREIISELQSEIDATPQNDREFRLSQLLLKKHRVEGFVDIGLEELTVQTVNEIYGTSLVMPMTKQTPEATLEMRGENVGVITFKLESLLSSAKNELDTISESEAEYVVRTFEDFLNTRRYDVTTMASWANGNNRMFFEEIFENEKFWASEPKYPDFKFESFFSPIVVSADCFLGKKFTLKNVRGPEEALWAARLFLDKVCFPTGIFLSAVVRQDFDVNLATGSATSSRNKPTIEFLPFSASSGGVLCETTFHVS